MTGMVIRDYFAAFRWQKIKESQKKGAWWPVIYFMTLMPLILRVYEGVNNVLLYYLIGIPIMFAMYVPTIHTMRLPKIMYLCPMSMSERKEYITKSCYMRIAVSVLVDFLAVLVLFLCGVCNFIMVISIFLNSAILSVAIGSGINVNGYGKITEEGHRVIDPKTKKEFLEMWICLVALLTCMAHYSIVLEEWDSVLTKVIAIGLPLVILLPPTIAYLRYWKDAVNRTMNYEG